MSNLTKKHVPKWIKQDYYHMIWEKERKEKLQALEAANIPIEPKQPPNPMDKLAQDWLKKEGELDVSGYTFEQLMRDY